MTKTNGKPQEASKQKVATSKKKKPVKPPSATAKKKEDLTLPHEKLTAWRSKLNLDPKNDSKNKRAIVPYTLQKTPKIYWPSALFFNAKYQSGILVHPKDNDYFVPTLGYANNKDGDRQLPCLSPAEAALWCQKHAAHTAVARRFPVEVGRLLGTITVEVKEIKPKKAAKGKGKSDPNALVPESLREIEKKMRNKARKEPPSLASRRFWRDPKQVKRISTKQATDEAAVECQGQTRDKVQKRAHEIQDQWKHIQNSEPYPESWNAEDGSYNQLGKDDEHFVALKALQAWLAKGIKDGTLVDLKDDEAKELYGGRIKVPINATDVIGELVNLANPKESIYGVPLICAYPRMSQSGRGVWKIQLGVYMNRLLPEIFTCQSLHIVMSALDEGSYQVSEPICLPPLGKEVFQSAPYPKVDTRMLESDCSSSAGDSDMDMEGGSRDELLISPFSVKGLLKLLENKGCDTSNWPQLEKSLRGKFKLDLLLHQQHAICWMVQMENLEGAYGINSLLWEKRAFPDGGHYFYSPALGQMRLGAPPPRMRGGLLCDEQGLGKTVCVLGLIMATRAELKARLDKKKRSTKYEGDEYYSADSEDDDYLAHSTLIIVPPALLAQWLHEIEKAVGKTTLTVSKLVARTGELIQCLPPPATGDDSDESEDSMDDYDRVLASDIIVTTYDALDKACCSTVLQSVKWGRVVLDEMQEIRSSTTKIAKNCESLQCERRWMLSGTPIYQGIEDLRGELNFLRLEPFGSAWDDGFFDFSITKPWENKEAHAVAVLQVLCLVALRRSKDMTIAETGRGLLDLKPMTVEFIPVAQTRAERALYCFLEWLVSCELELTKSPKKNKKRLSAEPTSTTAATERANAKSRALCLRLLRELCISPMLLNGGLGTKSQLKQVNELMIRHNQRENVVRTQENGSNGSRAFNEPRVMSCDQALRFLTQQTFTAKTDEDFVTDVVMGGSRAVSNRDRAEESPEQRFNDAKNDVESAEKALAAMRSKRAKARWHLALEQITTGHYSDGRKRKFCGIWLWRKAVCAALEKSKSKTMYPLELLTRGWRPSKTFLDDLHTKHPKWGWSHPHALLATNIPKEVSLKEIATAMRNAAKRVPLAEKEQEKISSQILKLKKTSKKDQNEKIKELEAKLEQIKKKMAECKKYDSKLKLPAVSKIVERKDQKGWWKAIVQFQTVEEKERSLSKLRRVGGSEVCVKRPIPHMTALIKNAEENVEFAESECKVYPSSASTKQLSEAKRELATANMGLRLVTVDNKSVPPMPNDIAEEAGTNSAYILCGNAVGQTRSFAPRTASALLDSTTNTINQQGQDIPKYTKRIEDGKTIMKMLDRVVTRKVSPQIAKLTAYETLEALSSGEVETKTQCVICLGYLGQAEEDAQHSNAAGQKRKREEIGITMINCSHFYCTKCIRLMVSKGDHNCPSCRKPFLLSETIQVDINLKDEEEALKKERKAAKDLVREAGKLLADSTGHLEPEMWRALYLSFDQPTDVSHLGNRKFPAIPKDVLMHLRSATGLPEDLSKSERAQRGSVKGAGRNSKIQALLDDLPERERCVVFSANKDCLYHLAEIFKDDKIGFQLICTGLDPTELRDAVSKWESDSKDGGAPPFPVLLVHAGAASAGLTLTAASKMYLMEPFLKQEQEHQAYARCHRYSQTKKVQVKVFYTPVSVESRLLEWRKGGKSALICSGDEAAEKCNFEENTEIIIHDIDKVDDDEGSGSDDDFSENGDVQKQDGNEAGGGDSHELAQTNYLLGLM